MGNTLNLESSDPIVSDDPLLKDYRAATIDDFMEAKDNFDQLQAAVGDKMTVTPEEFDDVFSLICQDPQEHFALFDSWEVGKVVDVMEVFAVIIVYCDAMIEEKVPLLFDLFDFDHSKEMSQDELVLLMLCTTRGLCKVVGMPRPATDSLEALATDAFAHIDADRSGQISLEEFSKWILHEQSAMAYLAKFANTRVIYENQVQYDLMMKEICTAFMNFSEADAANDGKEGQQTLLCSEEFCEEMIQRYCPATEKHEITVLLRAMKAIMAKNTKETNPLEDYDTTPTDKAHTMISMDAFFLVISPYAAFLAADDDGEHSINIKELKILIWLLRGSEPSQAVVDSFMKSLDDNRDGFLSAAEWVSYALETNKETGSQSFANQIHLLFATADLNGDAVLSLSELEIGLRSIFADHLDRVKSAPKPEAAAPPESAWEELTAPERVERRRRSQFSSITSLVAELAKEIMQELDGNESQRIEWYEFRQHLDYLEQRVMDTKAYIQEHVLDPED
ncbi:putative EF hand containing protein [Phytophthora cinnamomi]|uniref:putative EF hand containing protein n=1 Tax=Phytophthora cinnamomi TaxID=4785 RepID=UPI0035596D15|nr:putative EF hand containing protein [Phytophthora cinnamomi]